MSERRSVRAERPRDDSMASLAKDMLSLSLLQARLIDLKLPIKIAEGD